MQFGDRLKELQDRSGLRAVDVCDRSGVKKSTYSQWVNNRRTPDLETIYRLVDAFKLELGDQTFFLLTGQHFDSFLEEKLPEIKQGLFTHEQFSAVMSRSLEDLEELGVIEFKNSDAINQTISLIHKRMQKING